VTELPVAAPQHAPVKTPIETKVQTAGAGGVAGGAVASAILYLLGRFVFKGAPDNGVVPNQISTLVIVVVPAAFAWIGGYLGRHTSRPDLAP
jgi:hypothetical protein